MAIPVVTLGEQGQIATRPRRNPFYDTEGYEDGTAIPTQLKFYGSTNQFQQSGLALAPKKYGRDTNAEVAGALSKGDYFHWYGIALPVGIRNVSLTSQANVVQSEEINRIRMGIWYQFNFGNTPYILIQADEIPVVWGIPSLFTTWATATVYPPINSRLKRSNDYDVTIGGLPTEITDLETFAAFLNTVSGFTPSPTNEIYWTHCLTGTYLKGIRG